MGTVIHSSFQLRLFDWQIELKPLISSFLARGLGCHWKILGANENDTVILGNLLPWYVNIDPAIWRVALMGLPLH